ncbi:MAG: MBL fold metallo-hydrolase [Bacteroidetes bacterium]|nr:MBL fold metallo-hydrolase [Bacteroidota bacterium]MDA0902875.1 MBL fold metallo-hydrolase [Bacteroidota bacterium]MDA1241972.1 MBL fold metallo-hydrolase [Bacteroidota bacterium]
MQGDVPKTLPRATFLGSGTSQGVPIIGCSCEVCHSDDPRDHRLRCSLWVEVGGKSVVIDTGPDFRIQMLRERVQSLDAVVYTHEHKDHLAGMDDIRPFNFLQRTVMPIYASERVEAALHRDFHYAFEPNKHGGVPDVDIRLIEGDRAFELGEATWQPLPLMHAELPIHGYRVEGLAYITDANHIPNDTWGLLDGVDTLVVNALRPSPHYSHFSLDEALDVARHVGARQTYLTHISHLMGLHSERNATLPEGISLAFDGLQLERRDQEWHPTNRQHAWTL